MADVIVIGFGSIGQRHARLLRQLGHDVRIVSRHATADPAVFRELAEAFGSCHPAYVVVANPTADHAASLSQLAALNYEGTVLMEKPIFDSVRSVPEHSFSKVAVGYNLRFHPALQRLRNLLDGKTIVSMQVYVGQYLPEWRPETDYRLSYSARASKGGGVLRDLSHDLDYVCWIAGNWQRVAAIGGKFSDLEIDSDDNFSLLLSAKKCPAISIQMNYLDRLGRREVVVNTVENTYAVDLVRNILRVGQSETHLPVDRDESYLAMHKEAMAARQEFACSVPEAMNVLKLIEASEAAANSGEWVCR